MTKMTDAEFNNWLIYKMNENIKQQDDNDSGAHYRYEYQGVKLDPYRILQVYGISHPALQHLVKKALRAGRGKKSLNEDLLECRDTIDRCLEMIREDIAATIELEL